MTKQKYQKTKLSGAFILLHLAICAGVIGIDQATKLFAVQNKSEILMNAGIIGGVFQNHHPLVKTLFIANSGLLISLVYLFVVFFVLQKRKFLSAVVTFLYAAIFSNLIDRVRLGAVIDFIRIGTTQTAAYLNVADLIQQASVIAMIIYCYRYRKDLIHDDEKRGQYLLDAKAQLSGATFFASITFVIGFGISALNYIFFNSLGLMNEYKAGDHVLLAVMASFFCSVAVFIFTILYTFRFVGPVMALKKYLESGPATPFSLRKNDLFQFIVAPVNKALNKTDHKKTNHS